MTKCRKSKSVIATQAEAEAMIRRLWKSAAARSRAKIPTRAYYCNSCSGWHLTAMPRNQVNHQKRGRRR